MARCANPRDKAFALLSLAASCCRSAVSVDYEQSIYSLWNVLLAHHLYHHCSSFTDVYGGSTVIPSLYKEIGTQRLRQSKAIRDLLWASMPENQCVLLEAQSTNLFSVSNAKHFNDRKGETVELIGKILGSVYYVSPVLGRCKPFPDRPIKPSEMMHDTIPPWKSSWIADRIKMHLDRGLSSHTISNPVSAPSHRSHSITNFSTQVDLIQEVLPKHPTFDSRYTNTTARLFDNTLSQNCQVTVSQAGLNENSGLHNENSSDFLIGLLNALDGMVSKSCSTSTCVLVLEENGNSVLAPPNIQIGDVICRIEAGTIYLILRPNDSGKAKFGGYTDAEVLTKASFNSDLYTIVGQAVTLFWSGPGPNKNIHAAPVVKIRVDAPALQILTRLSSSEESASTKANEYFSKIDDNRSPRKLYSH
jgi:hypothetical protein